MKANSGQTMPWIVIGILVALVVVTGVWWFWNEREADGVADTARSAPETVTAERIETIKGRWRRTDGGYVIDVRGIDGTGNFKVAYFNPRPINVSQAQVVQSKGGLHIFVELRDTGYPGATYRLDFDSDNDVLTGLYHQPAVNQTFDVIFVRE